MSNVYNFSNIGTPDGEARARQDIINSTYNALTNGTTGLKNFPIFLALCFEEEVWKKERILYNGSRCNPVSFHEFVHAGYPTGLDTTYDTIRPLIESDIKLLALWDAQTQRGTGGANNPNRDPETGRLMSSALNVDNIHVEDKAPPRPTGTAQQAGLRRLRKAAEEGDSRARQQFEDVLSGRTSVHAACVALGWRKPTLTVRDEPVALFEAALRKSSPLETAKRVWLRMSPAEQEEFLDWAGRN
jgi:hypothetical protein